MLKKDYFGKGVSIVLVVSMFGMGSPAVPSAYAASVGIASKTIVKDEQNVSLNILSKLEIQGIAFDKTFSSDIFQYTASVDNNVQNVTLQVSSNNEKAKITANGQTVEDGSTQPLPLQIGDNQIVIKVDDGVNPANTYNLTVSRKKSSNNLLTDLQISSGELSPKFDAATTSYTVQVANEVNEITVTPVVAENTETVKVNDTPANDKGVTIQLPIGKTEITILITAENGDQKTYTIAVTKAGASSGGSGSSNSTTGLGNNHPSNLVAAGNNSPSYKNAGSFASRNGGSSQMQGLQQGGTAIQQPSKATLSALTLSSGTWNKSFSKDTFTYHIAVSNDIDTVTINSTVSYSGAAVKIGDGTSNTISLGVQKKTIVPVVVTKDDERKTYILVFDKDVPQAVSTEAASQTVSNETSAPADPSVKNSSVTPTVNNWNGKNNTSSASFWSRLVESIRSFFSKL